MLFRSCFHCPCSFPAKCHFLYLYRNKILFKLYHIHLENATPFHAYDCLYVYPAQIKNTRQKKFLKSPLPGIFFMMLGQLPSNLRYLRIVPCCALPQSTSIFAYRGTVVPLLCSYEGGSQGFSPTYEQAHVGERPLSPGILLSVINRCNIDNCKVFIVKRML